MHVRLTTALGSTSLPRDTRLYDARCPIHRGSGCATRCPITSRPSKRVLLACAMLTACAPEASEPGPRPDAAGTDTAVTGDDRTPSNDLSMFDGVVPVDSADMTTPLPDRVVADTSETPPVPKDVPASMDVVVSPDTPTTTTPLFDLAAIRDPSTAACTYGTARTVSREGATVEVRDLSFRSWEVVDGVSRTITLRGYYARPTGLQGRAAGIVLAHGLGGAADEGAAAGLAARVRATVIAYTGPGGGTVPANTSEGLPSGHDRGRRMFDSIPDPRGSWFWGHVVGALRALTCLAHHPLVDPTRLGMTGYSAGAVATLLAAGVDDRIVAAVPLSGTLAWDVATRSPNAWQHELLRNAGLDTNAPAWTRLMDTVVSLDRVRDTRAQVLMVNGTTDEFFPLTAHMATFLALPATRRRTSLAANFDHGCYGLTGGESRTSIEARADLRAKGAQQAWFGHFLTGHPDYARLPASPTLSLSPAGAGTLVTATVDESVGALPVEDVRFWWSGDRALTFLGVELPRRSAGVYATVVPVTVGVDSVVFVDVQYRTRAPLGTERFSLSSPPVFADALIPQVRRIGACVP